MHETKPRVVRKELQEQEIVMEWKDVISLIAVCVTLLLGVIGFIINSFIQRKSNSISVITKTRLNRREKTKTLWLR